MSEYDCRSNESFSCRRKLVSDEADWTHVGTKLIKEYLYFRDKNTKRCLTSSSTVSYLQKKIIPGPSPTPVAMNPIHQSSFAKQAAKQANIKQLGLRTDHKL